MLVRWTRWPRSVCHAKAQLSPTFSGENLSPSFMPSKKSNCCFQHGEHLSSPLLRWGGGFLASSGFPPFSKSQCGSGGVHGGCNSQCPDRQPWLTRPTQMAVTSCGSPSSTALPGAQSSQERDEGLTWLPAQASLAVVSPSPGSSVTAQVLPLAPSYGETSWWVSLLHSPPVWHP